MIQKKQNRNLVPFARMLRREMTKEERHLWYDFLHDYPVKFTRQKVLGKYVADFYCAKAKLVIELDGSQHYEDHEMKRDQNRTEYLERFGISVVRFPNCDVNQNFQRVCESIDILIKRAIEE